MMWKETVFSKRKTKYPLLQRAVTIVAGLAFVVSTIWMYIYNLQEPDSYSIFVMVVATSMACLGILILGARAAATITTEKEQETWQALVSSPLEGREIIAAKIWGAIYSMRVVLLLLLVLWVPTFFSEPTMLLGFLFSLAAVFAVALFAAALGVLLSLRSSSSNRAATWTLGTMVFLGGGYMFCCIPMMIGLGPGEDFVIVVYLAPCSPFLIGFPAMAAWSELGGGEEFLYSAYMLGVLGYAIGAGVVYSTASSRFDEFAGRTKGNRVWTSPPVPRTEHAGPISLRDSASQEKTEGD